MFEITLITMGKLKEKFYISAAEEYKKRLGGYCKFTLLELPEVRLPENPSPAEIAAGLEKEAETIFAKIPKGATVGLTRAMGVELGKYNIRVNCIAPAAIQTEMVKESNLSDPDFDNDFFLRQITPLGRWGKAKDIAELACFLASDEASYLNGVIIPADGGITMNGNVNKM